MRKFAPKQKQMQLNQETINPKWIISEIHSNIAQNKRSRKYSLKFPSKDNE